MELVPLSCKAGWKPAVRRQGRLEAGGTTGPAGSGRYGDGMASGMNIDLNIGAAFGAIRGWLADRKFSDQERAEIELQLGRAELEAQRSAMEMAGRIAAAESAVVVAEAQGGSWLQRNWRPMLMVLFAGLVLLMWCGVSSDQLTEDLKLELMDLIKLGMGGYIAGRSIEKATQHIATAVASNRRKSI